MSDPIPSTIDDLSKDELIRLAGLYAGAVLVHYGMWFTRTAAKHGPETAVQGEDRVFERYGTTALRRLAARLGIELEGGVPRALKEQSRDDLAELVQDLAKTWLTGDGLWFQALEGHLGMAEAKEVNDSCWSLFGQLEAYKVRQFLGLEIGGGLCAMERALPFRLYSSYNAHESEWPDKDTLVWRMKECRVQQTRTAKGLEPYHCRSAGEAEYAAFSQGIDPRIRIACVACPPNLPEKGGWCEWRFGLA